MSVRLLAILFVLLAGCGPASAWAQTADDLFSPFTLHDLQLFMNSADLQQLQARYDENTFYQADLEWRGTRVRSAAVRSRGGGSRSPTKPGMLIDFDRFAAGQRFLGLSALVLDNGWQDPSFVRESVTMAMFARMGQPAPRESYARLFINGTYYGVYAIVEPVDAPFLARVFGDSSGYVFEYQWLREFHAEYLGPSLDRYEELFRAETHDLESETALYAPVQEMFREINAQPSATWRESVERYVDVRSFLTHVAIEMFIAEADGLLGNWAMNNFYLYRRSGSTVHTFIPWDRDIAFQGADSSVLLHASDNQLMRRLLEYPDLRSFYLDALEQCAQAASGWLEQDVAARANLIREAVYADTRKPDGNDAFESSVAWLLTFAQARPANVSEQVSALRNSN
jgi:spore coat protein CotH